MKHIQTSCDAEKSLRQMYKKAAPGSSVTAHQDNLASLSRIIDLTRKIDELKFAVSEETAKLLGYIQHHEALLDQEGRTLATWKNGRDKSTVDYDAIILEMNIPPSVIAKHTTATPGARVFKIEDENINQACFRSADTDNQKEERNDRIADNGRHRSAGFQIGHGRPEHAQRR